MNRLVVAAALGAGMSVNAAAQPCMEGTLGVGPRARRVIVERTDDTVAQVQLMSRPPRTIRIARLQWSERLVASDSTAWLDAGPPVMLSVRSGTDTLRSVLAPTVRHPRSDEFTGDWHARVGPGGVIRLVLHLAEGPCGVLVGTFDSPDQGQSDLPITRIQRAGDSIIVDAVYMDLRLAIPGGKDDRRETAMTQAGLTVPIELRRGAGVARRPQEPAGVRPYLEHEVQFPSKDSGVTISGTLSMPSRPGRHAAVVLISGSGPQDRDETIAGHRPFLILADRLTRAGYAVLRTDDRGVGGSSGSVLHSGLGNIAADVRGALEYLRSRADIDTNRMGLLGHSEGGLVAPIVATRDRVAFVILLAAPAIGGRELLTAQRAALAAASGDAREDVRVDSLLLQRIFDVLSAAPPDDALGSEVDAAIRRWLDAVGTDRPVAERLLAARTAVQDSQSIMLWTSPWFKSLYRHDPQPILRRLNIPTFVTIGSLDLQVPAWQSVPAFVAAFSGPRRALLTLEQPVGVNHMLQRARTGRMEEYAEIEETIAPEVLDAIERWIVRIAPPINSPTEIGR